ncbi:11S globulin seed storage protein Ana o 2.0101-like [Euphorbia lathyris]|uniref:11S globulin seed storage protein Ana o 2.0101-like n=1 Tax=Euphorbia lathyris TaxID=212925 RepID=UPI0033131374
MAKSALLLVLCLVVVSFHGSAANRQDRQLDECQLRSINAREPDDKIECEAGLVETWNPNHDQFQCAGVAVIRRTIQPKGLRLPIYSNAPTLVYIVQGRGMYGVMLPGCPETFQESQQSRGSMEDQDQHQQIRRFRQGDIIALPAGVAHWGYNDGNEDVVAVSVLDTANGANQLDNMPRHFYLAGNLEDDFRKHYQQQGKRPLFPSPRYSSRGRQSEKSSCNNLFCGMDSKMIAEAFNIDEQLARKLQSQNDFRGGIVRVEEQLQVVRPPRTQQEMQQMEREQCRPGGGCVANGAEETYCSMRLKENIADPSRADIYVPEVGRVSTVNGHNLPILQSIRMSASHVVLHCDAMRMPHWHLHAHSIMYCVEGQARVQIVDENGKSMFDGTFRKGQVLTVPQNFVVMKQAESERFEYVAFKTSAYTMTTDLAGRTSAFRAMPVEVIANAFQMSVEDAMKIKYGREETTLGMSRRQQSRRISNLAAAAVATIAEVATSV